MPPASERSNDRRAWVVGITGGIGSGKSTVAGTFRSLGARVLDADAIARRVTADPAVVQQIGTLLGGDTITPDGVLDRARVAELVFQDQKLREGLEAIVHPAVRTKIDKELAKWRETGSDDASPLPRSRPLIILDVPLLERSPYLHEVSAVVFVDAPLSVRIERVQRTRGWSEDELARREASQVSVVDKKLGADHVVMNDDAVGEAAESADLPKPGLSGSLATQCAALIDLWAQQLD